MFSRCGQMHVSLNYRASGQNADNKYSVKLVVLADLGKADWLVRLGAHGRRLQQRVNSERAAISWRAQPRMVSW
jgi:hypothetical protein